MHDAPERSGGVNHPVGIDTAMSSFHSCVLGNPKQLPQMQRRLHVDLPQALLAHSRRRADQLKRAAKKTCEARRNRLGSVLGRDEQEYQSQDDEPEEDTPDSPQRLIKVGAWA